MAWIKSRVAQRGASRRGMAGAARAGVAVVLAAALGVHGAEATVKLGFESLGCAQRQATCELGEAILVKGYALRYVPSPDEVVPGALHAVGTSWPHNRRGPIALNINGCGAGVALMANDNRPFTPVSIALAEMDGQGPLDVTFTGTFPDGRTVSHAVHLSGPVGWRTVPFPPSFEAVSSVSWHQGECVTGKAHMFGAIELRPAPGAVIP